MEGMFSKARNFEEASEMLKGFISATHMEAFLEEEENIFGKKENFIMLKKHLVQKIPQSSIKVEVFSNEEGIPHFRVKIAEYTANYSIQDGSIVNGELPRQYHKKVLFWYRSEGVKQLIIDEWNKVRPHGCQIGEYKK